MILYYCCKRERHLDFLNHSQQRMYMTIMTTCVHLSLCILLNSYTNMTS